MVIEQMTEGDGSNVHQVLETLFEVMDVPFDQRDGIGLPNYSLKFPYVNGKLFSGEKAAPRFDRQSRNYLLHIGRLDWTKINPDIFGSMIQAITDEDERSSLGQHYTSVPSILKVLNPLFLDDLNDALEQAGDNARKLLNLKKRIARIRVFDPACGSGNFLVIAYKELRKIEAEINLRRKDPDTCTVIPLTNFRGIEIKGFSAEVARLALVIAEYQCDVEHRSQSEALEEFLPLATENWITHGNALTLDWKAVCPPAGDAPIESANVADALMVAEPKATMSFENEGGEVYICGNPPYLGATSPDFSPAKKNELASVALRAGIRAWKKLDFVSGWFIKAADYLERTDATVCAGFVSTNSICQGEQVAILWPRLLRGRTSIDFACQSYRWRNLASHNAAVTVVIVGLANKESSSKVVYLEGESGSLERKQCLSIGPYLIPDTLAVVAARNKAISSNSPMTFGSKPVDGGHLLLDRNEVEAMSLAIDQHARFIRRFYGSQEFINGKCRYAIWVQENDADDARKIQELAARIDGVRSMRSASKKEATRKLAGLAHAFGEVRQVGNEQSIIVPRVSSEGRAFLPAGVLPRGCIVADSASPYSMLLFGTSAS